MSSSKIIEGGDDIKTRTDCQEDSRRNVSTEEEQSKISEPMALTAGGTFSSKGSVQPAFSVAHCQEMGRYLVAAKDLDKGEIIFQEVPLTSGPERDSVLICPGCYQAPAEDASCNKCGWPLCGSDCPGISRHEMECSFLSEECTRTGEERDWRLLSDCLMVIRCLLLKYHDVSRWQSLLDMETNWDFWSRSPLYARGEETIRVLRNEFGMTEDKFTTDEMLDVQAVLDINAYEVRMPYVNIQASYAMARLAEHNCVPNTHKTISSTTLQLTLRAAVDIPKGTHLTTSYCDILWPTTQRQQYLQWSKFFTCKCARCVDPTELGSYLSALICPQCPDITPLLPNLSTIDKLQKGLTRDFDYKCYHCSIALPADYIDSFISSAEEQLQELDKDQRDEKSGDYEDWLARWTICPAKKAEIREDKTSSQDSAVEETGKKYGPTSLTSSTRGQNGKGKTLATQLLLHPQNSVVLDACHTLFLLYSKEESTPEEELERKIQLGIHLLQATNSIISGISKFRGTVMYEMSMTKIASFVRRLETGDRIDENAKRLAQNSLEALSESLDLLQYEPVDQPEGILGQTGCRQLAQLKSFLEKIMPDLPILNV